MGNAAGRTVHVRVRVSQLNGCIHEIRCEGVPPRSVAKDRAAPANDAAVGQRRLPSKDHDDVVLPQHSGGSDEPASAVVKVRQSDVLQQLSEKLGVPTKALVLMYPTFSSTDEGAFSSGSSEDEENTQSWWFLCCNKVKLCPWKEFHDSGNMCLSVRPLSSPPPPYPGGAPPPPPQLLPPPPAPPVVTHGVAPWEMFHFVTAQWFFPGDGGSSPSTSRREAGGMLSGTSSVRSAEGLSGPDSAGPARPGIGERDLLVPESEKWIRIRVQPQDLLPRPMARSTTVNSTRERGGDGVGTGADSNDRGWTDPEEDAGDFHLHLGIRPPCRPLAEIKDEDMRFYVEKEQFHAEDGPRRVVRRQIGGVIGSAGEGYLYRFVEFNLFEEYESKVDFDRYEVCRPWVHHDYRAGPLLNPGNLSLIELEQHWKTAFLRTAIFDASREQLLPGAHLDSLRGSGEEPFVIENQGKGSFAVYVEWGDEAGAKKVDEDSSAKNAPSSSSSSPPIRIRHNNVKSVSIYAEPRAGYLCAKDSARWREGALSFRDRCSYARLFFQQRVWYSEDVASIYLDKRFDAHCSSVLLRMKNPAQQNRGAMCDPESGDETPLDAADLVTSQDAERLHLSGERVEFCMENIDRVFGMERTNLEEKRVEDSTIASEEERDDLSLQHRSSSSSSSTSAAPLFTVEEHGAGAAEMRLHLQKNYDQYLFVGPDGLFSFVFPRRDPIILFYTPSFPWTQPCAISDDWVLLLNECGMLPRGHMAQLLKLFATQSSQNTLGGGGVDGPNGFSQRAAFLDWLDPTRPSVSQRPLQWRQSVQAWERFGGRYVGMELSGGRLASAQRVWASRPSATSTAGSGGSQRGSSGSGQAAQGAGQGSSAERHHLSDGQRPHDQGGSSEDRDRPQQQLVTIPKIERILPGHCFRSISGATTDPRQQSWNRPSWASLLREKGRLRPEVGRVVVRQPWTGSGDGNGEGGGEDEEGEVVEDPQVIRGDPEI